MSYIPLSFESGLCHIELSLAKEMLENVMHAQTWQARAHWGWQSSVFQEHSEENRLL